VLPIVWTRRDFLARAAALSALSCLMAPAQAAYHFLRPLDFLERDFSVWRAAVGSAVRIRTRQGGDLRGRIAEVLEYRRPSPGSPYHQYSILFALEGETRLAQDVHRVEHAQFGAADLLLVPVLAQRESPSGPSIHYEAVITRSQHA
jgi:hypothetical protein